MEADWEVEIGPGAPVIEARWTGFVDLRADPDAIRNLPEVVDRPALANSLLRLNALASPVWTSKCDVWAVLDPREIDPYEMNAAPEDATHAWACYIDLLPRHDRQWITPQMAVSFCQAVCARMQAITLANCRADLIVRRAVIAPDKRYKLDTQDALDHAVTAYLSACGSSSEAANRNLANALNRFADALCGTSTVK